MFWLILAGFAIAVLVEPYRLWRYHLRARSAIAQAEADGVFVPELSRKELRRQRR
jgi:hypothetical protein